METAVVTGAGRGLGKEIAGRLATRGLHVFVTDIDEEAAAATAAELGPGRATSMVHDVRDPAAHRAVARAAAERGRLAVWINNAGVLRAAKAWEHGDDELRLQVDVNFSGMMFGARAAIDAMGVAGPGHIINVASLSSIVPAPGLAVYAGTKHAVLGFTLSLAGDLRAAGSAIEVSAVCPAPIDTELVRRVSGTDDAAILFSSGLLSAAAVADATVALLDRPRLVVTLPASKAALAHVFRPFPAVGLRVLEQFRKMGQRVQQRDTLRRATSRTHKAPEQ
jgi:short-subunit dehydrogenase